MGKPTCLFMGTGGRGGTSRRRSARRNEEGATPCLAATSVRTQGPARASVTAEMTAADSLADMERDYMVHDALTQMPYKNPGGKIPC